MRNIPLGAYDWEPLPEVQLPIKFLQKIGPSFAKVGDPLNFSYNIFKIKWISINNRCMRLVCVCERESHRVRE